MNPVGYLTEVECPNRYPADASLRADWLLARGWVRISTGSRESEVWRSETGFFIQGRTNACRAQLGLDPLER